LQRKQARIDGENLQPTYNVQIPPPRVVTPPHPPQTPEHQIFSSSSIVSPTTRSESDEDDFDADNRNPRNLTFDEYVDGDDADDDDDRERVFLDDSVAFDESGEDNPYMFQEKNISALFISYRLKAWQMARESGLSIETDYREILSLSHILLLQADNFSDL